MRVLLRFEVLHQEALVLGSQEVLDIHRELNKRGHRKKPESFDGGENAYVPLSPQSHVSFQNALNFHGIYSSDERDEKREPVERGELS